MTGEKQARHRQKTGVTDTPDLLPNFCDNQVLLVVLLVAEALAIILTLSQASTLANIWVSLGNTSFFILIIALIDAAVLCVSNRFFKNLTIVSRSLLLYLVLQLITLLVTLAADFTLNALDIRGISHYTLLQALIRNLSISLIITGVMLRYFYVRHQSRLHRKAEELAHIQALQARIRPHFLFNSLNTIASLVHQNPDMAEEAILDLAELFRSTLSKTSHITLGEELDIVNRYLRIEQLRLGDRLRIEREIADDVMNVSLPALLIQPLVENAVYHGIEPLANGGCIQISAQRVASTLSLKISNPVSIETPPQRTSGNQLALSNIRQRLELAFGNQASMQLMKDPVTFCVTLCLPIQDINDAYSDR
ncbi:MAG: histidine kinase [Gammaproteobacteria bacterium]|nr:histidine kinase [Gammaproteobacteria bacterium]